MEPDEDAAKCLPAFTILEMLLPAIAAPIVMHELKALKFFVIHLNFYHTSCN